MSIIRFCQERADGSESQIYAFFVAGGDSALRIGRKPEDHYPSSPREWTGDIIIPPDDFSELVARLLERGEFEDVEGVRAALEEVFEDTRDHEQEVREQQTDPRSAVLSDKGRNTIARLWLNRQMTDAEAEELVGEDTFTDMVSAWESVEETINESRRSRSEHYSEFLGFLNEGETEYEREVATSLELDDDGDEPEDECPDYHELETATSGRENWEKTTPTDAGESLFGGDDIDMSERVEDEWVEETTPAERVRSILRHTYEAQSVSEIANRARTSENTARKRARSLVSEGFAVETSDPNSNETLYKRSEESLVIEEASRIRREVDDVALSTRVSEMQEELRAYREEYGAESPEDAALSDTDIDSEGLQTWQTVRRNLGFARVALAISNAEKNLTKEDTPDE